MAVRRSVSGADQESTMPELVTVLTPESFQRERAAGPDLAPYRAIINQVREEGGVGGVIKLEEGESQRTEKRRMSVVAKQEGYDLTWRTSPPGTLRFVLARPGEPAPGSRPRRSEQIGVKAIMTPAVAGATGTTAGAGQARGGATRRRTGARQSE